MRHAKDAWAKKHPSDAGDYPHPSKDALYL